MRRCKQEGAALMLVLWVIVLLTAIVAEFAFSMRTEVNITRNFKEEAEAYYAAVAGLELAKEEILSAKEQTYLNKDGELIFGEKTPDRKGILGNTEYSYTIIDEDRKINLNSAAPEQLRYLLKYANAGDAEIDAAVDSILDWRDADNLHRLNGAEEDYYQSLPKPYSCKDGPFDTVEELLMVKGVTPEMLYGSKDDKGIARYLTAKSSNIININTADRVVLEAKLGSAVTETILMQRSAGPIFTPMAGGMVTSTYFTIISRGGSGKIRRAIKAVIMKKNDAVLDVLYWNDNFTEGFQGLKNKDNAKK